MSQSFVNLYRVYSISHQALIVYETAQIKVIFTFFFLIQIQS